MDKHIRIAIIGAGIAGLNAALTLQDAGLACSIYDASNRICGRMHSDATTWADGMVSEWCGEFIDSDHRTLLHLIERFRLKTIDLGRGMSDQAQTVMYFFDRYYDEEEVWGGLRPIYPILQQQVQEAGFPTTYTHFTETGYRLDHLSAYDWIEQYVKGGHNTPLGRLLDSGCRGYFGLETRMQSSLNLVYTFGSWFSEDEQDAEDDEAVSSGPMQGSFRIAGGNQQLPLAIAHSLPEGCIQLQHQLVAIQRNSDDSINLSFTTP